MIQKRSLLTLVFTFLFITPFSTFSQQNYFTNRLIIKFESNRQLQQIRYKQGIDPKSRVQQLLSKTAGYTVQPLIAGPIRQTISPAKYPSADEVLRIQEITFNRPAAIPYIAAKLSTLPGVAYAEPRYIRRMSLTPNDPVLEKYIDVHNFTDAWDISRGSSNITIAIVDGGVGYTHPELDDNLWINQSEVPLTVLPQADQNNDGRVTSTEIARYLQQNGDDYDGNGQITLQDALHEDSPFMDNMDADNNEFTDDLFGWDFWASGGTNSSITSDNNPFHDGTDHGTHVAGIAAAESNNGTGIAGAAFNTNYMAIKAGGISDDPNTTTDESRSIGFGFPGMLYAAQQGADIINCSWGGASASEAEQDIINLVTEMGSVIVAAAGNQSNNQVDYPSGYENVVSVGSIETNNSLATYSNYGYKVDVFATGTNIQSTTYNKNLVSKSGTSMSTPVVSGLAALLKEHQPSWSALRIGMQIRTSGKYINNSNISTNRNSLGHGAINAFRALDTDNPGIKILSADFVNEDGNKLGLNEPGSIQLSITNVGNTTSDLELNVESLNQGGIDLANPSQQIGSLNTGDTVSISFDMRITSNFDLNSDPSIRVQFSDSDLNYDDFDIVEYKNLLYDIIAANNVKTSVAADGTIGFTNPLEATGGVGFIPRTPTGSGDYKEGANILFEGGLMIQIDGRIYDAVRASDGLSRDFLPRQIFAINQANDGQMGSAQFVTDTDSARRAIINLETFALDESGIQNTVFVKYTIQNPSEFLIMENVYVGLFNDWDIDKSSSNNVDYINTDSLLYISGTSPNSTQPLTAVAHMGPIAGALAIDNTIEGQTDSVTFGLYDGFTNNEKSNALTSGTVRTSVEGTDVSAVVSSGPYTINPGAKIIVGFIYAFGNDLGQLRNQVSEARSRNLFEVSPSGTAVSDKIPSQTELIQNYPNPFTDETQVRIDLAEKSQVTISVYNVLGQKVRVLASRDFEAGSHFVPFRGQNLSSGIYFVRLKTGQGYQTIPVTLIK